MKLYTIGEAAAILDVDTLTMIKYCIKEKIAEYQCTETELNISAHIQSTDLEKIREAMRYRPL